VPGFDESSLWDEELDLLGQEIHRHPPYLPSPHDITEAIPNSYLVGQENFFNRSPDPAMTGIDGKSVNGLSSVIPIPANEPLFTHYQQIATMTN
jgi:hypothetical protein